MATSIEQTTRVLRADHSPLLLDDRQILDAVQRLKLIADETRMRILSILSEGEHNVTSLCQALGQSPPAVSHHLALLRVSGLIHGERQGKNIFYSIEDMGWALLNGCRLQFTK